MTRRGRRWLRQWPACWLRWFAPPGGSNPSLSAKLPFELPKKSMPQLPKLGSGYEVEVDTLNEHTWCQLLQEFDDASIYQTWPYVAVTAGSRNMSHLLLKKNGEVVAAALARIAKLPLTRI